MPQTYAVPGVSKEFVYCHFFSPNQRWQVECVNLVLTKDTSHNAICAVSNISKNYHVKAVLQSRAA